MTKILAIPGSLRSNSSSHAVLHAIASMKPEDVSFDIYDGVGSLPHFNDVAAPSDAVIDFRNRIKDADAVLICTPEYAFGIPGSLKNALDWTVGSGEFIDKPVGLVTASSQGERGHAALLLVLTAISAKVIEKSTLLISFVRAKLDSHGNVKDAEVSQSLKKVIDALVSSIRRDAV